MLQSLVFLAGGFLSAVYAQSTPSCSSSTIFIDSLAALQAVQNCTTTEGDIVIDYGEDFPAEIEFPVLEEVGGSFLSLNFAEDIMVSRLSAPKLARITNDIYISRWINLTTIDMPVFDQARRIRLNNLPKLESANLLTTVTKLEANYEVWNTSLTNITNSGLEEAVFVEIFDNPNLESLELTGLRNASYNVALRRNRPGLSVSLPSLEEAWYFDMQAVGSLDVPALKSVIGYFALNSSSLEALNAPVLESIGTFYNPSLLIRDNHGLVIVNNSVLDTISMPVLDSVRMDLIVRDNSVLTALDLPALHQVVGNVAIQGLLTEVSFPDLSRVGGEFTIGVDSSASGVCAPFQALKNNGSIRGDFSCPVFSAPPARPTGLDLENRQRYIDQYLRWVDRGVSGGSSNSGAEMVVPGFKVFTAAVLGLVLIAGLL